MFVNKLFTYSRAHISKSKKCFDGKSLTYYVHMKTKIFADFQICTSAPLNEFKRINQLVSDDSDLRHERVKGLVSKKVSCFI